METPNKNKLVADAIRCVLANRGLTIHQFAANPIPKNFWRDVYDALPDDHKLDINSQLRDRWTRKNKLGIQTNKIEILSILGYTDNDHNEELSVYTSNDHNEETPVLLSEEPSLPTLPSFSTLPPQSITEEDVRRIVREELELRLHQDPSSNNTHNGHTELCPEADTVKGQGKGRRLNRDYERVSITIDKELWKEFRAEQKRLHTTAPRLMDTILWHYYNKPRLSFE